MVKGVTVRVQSGVTLLLLLAFCNVPLASSSSNLVVWMIGARTEFSYSPITFGFLVFYLVVIAWRHLTRLEVKNGVLFVRRPFLTRRLELRHAVIFEGTWPLVARLRTADGKLYTIPLPEESISGAPAKELFFLAIRDQGGQVLCRGWHKPLEPDPVGHLRPRRDFGLNTSFAFQACLSLLGSLIVLLLLAKYVSWSAAAVMAMVAGVLIAGQIGEERRSFVSQWQKNMEILVPEKALEEFRPTDRRGFFSLGDLAGALLIRELAFDENGRRVSRLTLRTESGRIGHSGTWSTIAVGWDVRQSLMSEGVPLVIEELEAQRDSSEGRPPDR